MWKNKWTYIIGIDIILGIILLLNGYFHELVFLFVTVDAMCISGILGFGCLFAKKIRNIGYALLTNLLIIPCVFLAILCIGPNCVNTWYRLTGDDSGDIVYDINHNGYKYELIMHGEEYYKSKAVKDSVWDINRFDIHPTNKVSSKISIYGNYEQIETNRYMLIQIKRGYEEYSYQKQHGTFLLKDTLLLSNDTLYYFYSEPVVVRRRN